MATREPSSIGAAPALLPVVLLLSLPLGAHAQSNCSLGEGSARAQINTDPRGGNITRLTTPHFECADDVEIWSDSTVIYQFDQMALLYGSVRYLDRQREMRADNARYFYEVGRLQAQGNLVVTNHEDGSTVENGDLVYLRQTETRDIEEMSFRTGADGLRPRATVYPKRPEPEPDDAAPDSTVTDATDDAPADPEASQDADAGPPVDEEPLEPVEPAEPVEHIIVADSLFFRGDSYFDATGSVEIVRDSLFAFADYTEYEGEVGELMLDGSRAPARVVSSSFELTGRAITLASAADGSDEVRAVVDALLTGEDLTLTAPRIVLHLLDGELERMVAVPLPDEAAPAAETAPDSAASTPVRPLAVAEDIELTGDSLDLAAPAGVLERIFAAGNARSVSHGRTELNVEALPELARQDWIDADSIEVFLVPAPPDTTAGDGTESGQEYLVDHIVAKVRARSLYRLVPSDSSAVVGVDPPAVSYQVADQITIFMIDGQADRVESVGQVSGWHLEPLARPSEEPPEDAAPADSTAAPPDAPAPREPSPVARLGGDASPPTPYLHSRR